MGPKTRSFSTSFWTDGYVAKLLSDEKLLYSYLLTNPMTTLAGCYEITVGRIAFETGLKGPAVEEMLAKLEGDGKLKYRDEWLVILNFLKHQSFNDNMRKNVVSELEKVPTWVKQTVVTIIESRETLRKPFEPFLKGLPTLREIEIEVEKEKEKEKESEPAIADDDSVSSGKSENDQNVMTVFERWKTVTGHPKATLSKDRRTRIKTRQAERPKESAVNDLLLCLDGWKLSPWHQGENPGKVIYDKVSTIFRDNEQVETFMDLAEKAVKNTTENGSDFSDEYEAFQREERMETIAAQRSRFDTKQREVAA